MEKRELSKKDKLRNNILTLISVGLVVFAIVILARQYIYVPGQYQAPPTPNPTPVATPLPPQATPAPTPEPTPYVKLIPVRMYFTDRELSCPVETVGLVPYTDGDGNELYNDAGLPMLTMGTIDSGEVAAWLEDCVSPGEYGNSIFNGHVTWKKVAGIFSQLPKMQPGEEIVIEYHDGSTKSFIIESVEIFGIDDAPKHVMAFDTGDARITLVTCYGESWNSQMGTRDERCAVIAKPAE